MPSKSDDDEQRKSVDRVRAVGQTFANSVFALRDRVVSASGIAEVDSGDRTTTSGGSGMATKVIGTTESPSEGGADATEGGRTKLERDMERLQNMLFATERQLEAARREADALRMAGEAATTRYERQTRTLEAIRAEIDKTAARAIEAEERASRAEAEVVRLRVDGAEADRETARCTKQVEDAERRAAEELARRNALERVAMGLRRRVALAEDAASKTRGLHDAVAARRAAESALVDARTEAERWRARCVSVDALRERADAAERAERSLRERVNVLEREVESRDALLRQTRAERQKLSQMMGYYERELARKDTKISALRRSVRKLRSRRGDEGNDVDSLDNDSVHSLSWDRDAPPSITGDAGEMGQEWNEEMRHSFNRAGILRRTTLDERNRNDGPIKDTELDDEAAMGALAADERRRRRILEASPLLREVEEAHAQLQAAFNETAGDQGQLDDDVDLVERVKRLEASFGALTTHQQ